MQGFQSSTKYNGSKNYYLSTDLFEFSTIQLLRLEKFGPKHFIAKLN